MIRMIAAIFVLTMFTGSLVLEVRQGFGNTVPGHQASPINVEAAQIAAEAPQKKLCILMAWQKESGYNAIADEIGSCSGYGFFSKDAYQEAVRASAAFQRASSSPATRRLSGSTWSY